MGLTQDIRASCLGVRAKCDRKGSEDDVEGEREHMWVRPRDISMDGKDNEYSVAA